MLGDPLQAELLQVFDRREEPDRLRDRRRARLESPRQVVPLCPVDPDILEWLEPWRGGCEVMKEVWNDRARWDDLPWRFERGTPSIAVGVAGIRPVD